MKAQVMVCMQLAAAKKPSVAHVGAAQHKVSLLQHRRCPDWEVLVASLEAELHNAVKACSNTANQLQQLLSTAFWCMQLQRLEPECKA
jgi:predicted membrane chloride channel (bestrophin family)